MLKVNRDGSDRSKLLICSVFWNGLSQILFLKQYFKGIILGLLEILMITRIPWIFDSLLGMLDLGHTNTAVPIAQRDNSAFLLINGVAAIVLLLCYLAIYIYYINEALESYQYYCKNGVFKGSNRTISEYLGEGLPIIGILPTLILVVGLVVLPLLVAFLAAFTNFSAPVHVAPSMTFDWVGLDNFIALFGGSKEWTSAFIRVFIWTLCFALISTVLCYIGGLLLAYILHHNQLKFRPVIQTFLMLPYAVPAVISMIVWKNLLNGSFGVVNNTLMSMHLIHEPIGWLSDPVMAKITCIMISLWAGYSYFMLLLLTTLNTIPAAMYDAAATEGATRGQTIRKLVIPLLLHRTIPFILLAFTQNFNNFTTVFFLTGGNPALENTTTTSAGATDTLITWIYHLTFELMQFNYASVIIVIVCIILIPFTIWQFKKSKLY